MAKDINIHVKTQGAQQTKQQLDDIGKSSKRVGDSASRGGRKGAEGINELSESTAKTEGRFGKLKSSIASWVTGLVGITAIIAGITKAIRVQSEAIKEHARIAAEQQKKLISLQLMSDFYKERPQLRKEVAAYAELGRRPFEEVAEAWYTLRSQAGRMTSEQRQGILREALEMGRAYPEAPLTDLVNMFTLYAKATNAQDLNQVQNVLMQTITEAGASMGGVSKFMPQFLGPAMTGGLTGAEAAGLWAYATTLPEAGGIEKASTAIRNLLLILQGEGSTPEAQEMLRGFGVVPGMKFFDQLTILASQRQAGRFGLPQALSLAGRESASMLMGLLKEPEKMYETIENVVRAGAGQRDITAEALEGLMATDEVARLEEEGRRFDVKIQNIKGQDVKALRWITALKEYESLMREAGVPETWIDFQLWGAEKFAAFGATPPAGGGVELWSKQFNQDIVRLREPSRSAPTIIHYHYEQIMNLNPVAGDDERGPRNEPGVVP